MARHAVKEPGQGHDLHEDAVRDRNSGDPGEYR